MSMFRVRKIFWDYKRSFIGTSNIILRVKPDHANEWQNNDTSGRNLWDSVRHTILIDIFCVL